MAYRCKLNGNYECDACGMCEECKKRTCQYCGREIDEDEYYQDANYDMLCETCLLARHRRMWRYDDGVQG